MLHKSRHRREWFPFRSKAREMGYSKIDGRINSTWRRKKGGL